MSIRKNTKVLAVVAAINTLISSNKSTFKAGSTISEADFLALAAQVPGLSVPAYTTAPANIAKYNLQKVATYTKFNKLLAHRGLVIKASNYYTSFTIVDSAKVSTEVSRLADRSVACATASTTLATGYSRFSAKFSKLKSPELARVAASFHKGF